MIEYKLVNAIANVESNAGGGSQGDSGSDGGTGSGGSSSGTMKVGFKLSMQTNDTIPHTKVSSLTEGTTYKYKLSLADSDDILTTGTMTVARKLMDSGPNNAVAACEFNSEGVASNDVKLLCKQSSSSYYDALNVKLTVDRVEKTSFNSQSNGATRIYVYDKDDEEMTSKDIIIELSSTVLDLIFFK